MGKIALINVQARDMEVYDSEKDNIRLTIRMLETGAMFNHHSPVSREFLSTLKDRRLDKGKTPP